jgi:hypothetical protein
MTEGTYRIEDGSPIEEPTLEETAAALFHEDIHNND